MGQFITQFGIESQIYSQIQVTLVLNYKISKTFSSGILFDSLNS